MFPESSEETQVLKGSKKGNGSNHKHDGNCCAAYLSIWKPPLDVVSHVGMMGLMLRAPLLLYMSYDTNTAGAPEPAVAPAAAGSELPPFPAIVAQHSCAEPILAL